VVIIIPIRRSHLLTSNQRLHWAQKAERTRVTRETAWGSTVLNAPPGFIKPYARKMHCLITVQYPDRRRRDVHNLMPTVKAAIDGLVDAHVLTDDSDQWLVGPDLRVSENLCDPQYACLLLVEFEDA
jgi:crossover junction endodeoxyribonuclease RusA